MSEVKNQTWEKLILNIHSLLGTLLPQNSNFPSSELISLLRQHLAEKHAYTSICLNWNIIGLGRGMKKPSTILKSCCFFLFWLSYNMCTRVCDPAFQGVCECARLHARVCVAINSITHGLACLDLLLCIRDVPIGNTFGELDDFGSAPASHSCAPSNPFNATWWGGLMLLHLIKELKNHA